MVYCKNCNNELPDGTLFCGKCGAKIGEPKGKKRIILIAALSIAGVLLVFGIACAVYFLQPAKQYEIAQSSFANQNYGRAMRCYKRAGDYKDAQKKYKASAKIYYYTEGVEALEEEKYDKAVDNLKQADGYKDSEKQLQIASYGLGKEQFENGKYEEAIKTLSDYSSYEDASDILQQSHYNYAKELFEAGDKLNAGLNYAKSNGYKDSYDLAMSIANELVESGDFANAQTMYEGIEEKTYASYCAGMIAAADKDYKKARNKLKNAKDVFDGADKYNEVSYQYGQEQFEAGNYEESKRVFESISGYNDADTYSYNSAILYAKDEIANGNLNSAKRIISEIPAECSYDGVSAKDILDKLNSNSDWMALCGKWGVTSGQMRTTLDNNYYDYWWYVDFKENDYYIDVNCALNDDGTVNVKIKGSIPVYTNYSSWQTYLEYKNYNISVNQNVSSMGTIKIDDYASITLSTSKITFNYKKNDDNKNVYSDYVYKTDATYGNRTVEY